MSIIHLNRAGQNLGTFSLEEVQQGLDAGRFLGSDLGWRTGMENWKPLSQWADLTIPAEAPEPEPAPPGGESGGFTPAPSVSPLEPAVYAEEPVKDGPAWEQRATLGFFPALTTTIKDVLLEPSRTFEKMKTEGGFGTPFLFYFIVGLVASMIFAVLGMGYQALILPELAKNPQFAEMAAMAGTITVFSVIRDTILSVIWLVICSFLFPGLLQLSLMLVGGANKPYEATYRVWNYVNGATSAVMIVPVCGWLAAPIWYFVSATIGLSKVQGISTGKAFLAIILPVVVCCGCVAVSYSALIALFFQMSNAGHS
ncbi:MAG TPA: YIP1 family protein [Chthoniobacterales bacterium]